MKAAKIRRAHVVVHPEYGEQVVRDTLTVEDVSGHTLVVMQLANGTDWTRDAKDDIQTVKP